MDTGTDMRRMIRRQIFGNDIGGIVMRIIIVGLGKLGTTLAEQISGEDHDVTVIDVNSKLVENTVNHLVVFGIVGSGADVEIQ